MEGPLKSPFSPGLDALMRHRPRSSSSSSTSAAAPPLPVTFLNLVHLFNQLIYFRLGVLSLQALFIIVTLPLRLHAAWCHQTLAREPLVPETLP